MRSKKTLFLILVLFFISYVFTTDVPTDFLTGNFVSKTPIENKLEMQVYFCPKEDCVTPFIELIKNSTDIKCALYDLDVPQIINALKSKNATVYMEEDNKLEEFNFGYSSALMHNKFCIFDNNKIITGSMNPTANGAYFNNNNLIIIESEYLSKNYLDEFNEIKDSIYGKGEKVKYPKILYDSNLIENYFCPEDSCKSHVLEELDQANKSILFMTFSFTDKDIADTLILKESQGIEIKGVIEAKRTNMQYNVYNYLMENKIDVNKDTNPYNLHHKVFIIDEKTVITGSYNPTGAGNERNDENLLIIHDTNIAAKYVEEFNSLY